MLGKPTFTKKCGGGGCSIEAESELALGRRADDSDWTSFNRLGKAHALDPNSGDNNKRKYGEK